MIKEILLISTASLIVITKFFDCYTTQKYLSTPYGEKNPIARKFMIKFGVNKVIWGIFIFTVIITWITLYGSYYYQSLLYDVGFIILGVIVTAVQTAVVHTNYTGKVNLITKQLLRIY